MLSSALAATKRLVPFCFAVSLGACQLDATGAGEGVAGIDEEDVEELVDQARNVQVCGDMTAEELARADAISDSCRADIRSLLPDAQNNAESRVLLWSHSVDLAADTTTLRLQGLDADGLAVSASAFASASFSVEGDASGSLTANVSLLADATGDLISVAVVNDYSASMLDVDLDRVADIESDLFRCLPPVYEAEVTYFSTEISVRQPFTTDSALVLEAVQRDNTFDRQKTALYDGVGDAFANLESRTRPVKILVVSSDGHENASTRFERAQLLAEIEGTNVLVVVLSALLADVDDMRAIAGSRGVYFYTPFYDELGPAVSGFLDATKEAVEVVLDRAIEEGRTLNIQLDGETYAIAL